MPRPAAQGIEGLDVLVSEIARRPGTGVRPARRVNGTSGTDEARIPDRNVGATGLKICDESGSIGDGPLL